MTSHPDAKAVHRPADRWLVVGLAVLIVLGVWLSRRDRLPQFPGLDDGLTEPLAHVVLAAVLTLIAVRLLGRTKVQRPVLVGIGLVTVLTTAMELGQIPLSSRSASVGDLAANLAGALLGAALAVGLGRLRPRIGGWVLLATMVLVIAGQVAALVYKPGRPPLGPEFQRQLRANSCDTEPLTPPANVPAPSGPASSGPTLSYDLLEAKIDDTGIVVPDAGGGPALTAPGDEVPLSSAGLAFGEGHDEGLELLQSGPAGRSLSAAVQAEDSLFVEVVLTPSDLAVGPARIVAMTVGTGFTQVNFHIGQEGEELSVRLRLQCGMFNWTRLDSVFTANERRHIIVTFSDRRQRVWVDGRLIDDRRFVGDRASTANWARTMPLSIGNTPEGDRPFSGEIELVKIGLAEGVE